MPGLLVLLLEKWGLESQFQRHCLLTESDMASSQNVEQKSKDDLKSVQRYIWIEFLAENSDETLILTSWPKRIGSEIR